MEKAASRMNENTALLHYDYTQEGFWREVEPEFSKSIDRVLISLRGDDFSTLEEKYHLINAVKFIGCKDSEMAEKLKVYDTIQPYNELKGENKDIFMKEISKVINQKRIGVSPFHMKVSSNTNIEKILESAPKLGFTTVETVFPGEELEGLKEKFKGTVRNVSFKGPAKDDPFYSKAVGSNTTKALACIVKYTKPISYNILGQLPGSIQQRIENAFEDAGVQNAYNAEAASKVATATEGAILFGGSMVAGLLLKQPEYLLGMFSVLYSAIRFMSIEDGAFDFLEDGPTGHPLLKPIFWPLEKILEKTKGRVGPKPEIVEFQLKDPVTRSRETGGENAANYHSNLEQIAAYSTGEKAEKNLVWSLDNHYTQGEEFEKSMKKSKLTGFLGYTHLSREAGVMGFYNVSYAGPYRKISALICKPGERYALTYIKPEETPGKFEDINKIIASDKSFDAKIKTFFDYSQAEYLHISRFKDNEKEEDKTITR